MEHDNEKTLQPLEHDSSEAVTAKRETDLAPLISLIAMSIIIRKKPTVTSDFYRFVSSLFVLVDIHCQILYRLSMTGIVHCIFTYQELLAYVVYLNDIFERTFLIELNISRRESVLVYIHCQKLYGLSITGIVRCIFPYRGSLIHVMHSNDIFKKTRSPRLNISRSRFR